MDEQLAAIYGTGQPEAYDDDDLQKTAAAELLVKLAAEEGVDLDEFSDDEIAGMIDNLYKTAAEGDAPMTEEEKAKKKAAEEAAAADTSEEKVAEADFLGKVMAHSMVQELNAIEKEAGIKERAGEIAGKALSGIAGAGRAVGRAGAATGKALHGAAGTVGEKASFGKLTGGKAKALGYGLAGAGTVGTGAGIAALAGGKKKKASADESALAKLAGERAYEMLAQAGYVDEDGDIMFPQQPEEEKVASTLDQAVDIQALRILQENGFPVEWNE